MSEKLLELRKKHGTFFYESVSYELKDTDLIATFSFLLDPDIRFQPTLTFHHVDPAVFALLDPKLIESWLFQIGMVESFSYWKAACPEKFVVKAGYLNEDQLFFWKKLLQNGMSEFFFINQIDGWSNDFVALSCEHEKTGTFVDESMHKERSLVAIGGGKDSVVSVELVKKMNAEWASFTMSPSGQVQNMLQIVSAPQNIMVTRQLDSKILELNAQGYLNGHTPFSALLSFVITFSAYLYDYHYCVLSNEFSANEGNVLFLGKQINHQYSKTFEYEKDFREYCKKYLSTTVEYFSFLRPLHELQIAQLFTQFPQYFSVFLSCNRGQKTGHWCGECPKCLFVYSMLSPFLDAADVEKIFGQNLWQKESLKPVLDELTGMVECKSLECVGTRNETIIALYLTLQKYQGQTLSILLEYAQKTILVNEANLAIRAESLLLSFQDQNFLPTQFAAVLKEVMPKK